MVTLNLLSTHLSTIVDLSIHCRLVDLSTCRLVDLSTVVDNLSIELVDLSKRGSSDLPGRDVAPTRPSCLRYDQPAGFAVEFWLSPR